MAGARVMDKPHFTERKKITGVLKLACSFPGGWLSALTFRASFSWPLELLIGVEHPRLKKSSWWPHLRGLTGVTHEVRRNWAGEEGGTMKGTGWHPICSADHMSQGVFSGTQLG